MATMWAGLLLLIAIGGFQDVHAAAYLEIHFESYSADCDEDLGFSYCDPMFSFCLDRPRSDLSEFTPCYYSAVGESGHYQDTNYIDFSQLTSIKGITNPWIVYAPNLADGSVVLVVRIWDDDTFFDDELLVWGTTVSPTIYPSQSDAAWTDAQITSGSYLITFKVRIYCAANYYGQLCSTYCAASNQYTCDAGTGNKICKQGWTGPNCLEDINECSLNYCTTGSCQNTPGDYICTCSPGYSGRNCEVRGNSCESHPCSNNAACTPGVYADFTCICAEGWEGPLCDTKINPCNSTPCYNNMECIPSSDNSSYVCNCLYPTTGINCESTLPVTTTEITTTETTRSASVDQTLSGQTVTEGSTSRWNVSNQFQYSANEESFKYWHGILIALGGLLIVAAIILFVCLLMWRRKGKEHALRMAYENNAYNDLAEADMLYAGKGTQFGSMINEKIPPLKAACIIMTDGDGGIVQVDENGNVRQVKSANKITHSNIANQILANERADKNVYTDTGRVGTNSTQALEMGQAEDEAQYCDLDEMAVTRAGNTDHENESRASSGNDDDVESFANSTYSQPSDLDPTSNHSKTTSVQPQQQSQILDNEWPDCTSA